MTAAKTSAPRKATTRKTVAAKPAPVGNEDGTEFTPGTAVSDGFTSDGSVSLTRGAYVGTLATEHAFGRALLNFAQLTDVPSTVQRTDIDGSPMVDRFGAPVMVPNGTAAYYRRKLDALVSTI